MDLVQMLILGVGVVQAVVTGFFAFKTFKLTRFETKPPKYSVDIRKEDNYESENSQDTTLVIENDEGAGYGRIRDIDVSGFWSGDSSELWLGQNFGKNHFLRPGENIELSMTIEDYKEFLGCNVGIEDERTFKTTISLDKTDDGFKVNDSLTEELN